LKWSPQGAKDSELIFVSGHPGRTDRLDTVRHLQSLRDATYPYVLNVLRRHEVLLRTYSERSSENARRAHEDLFGVENSRKAILGMLAGLQDPSIMSKKAVDEQTLRAAVMKDAKLAHPYGDAWDQVAGSIRTSEEIYRDYSLLEGAQAFDTTLFEYARTLVRLADETAKRNRGHAYDELETSPAQLSAIGHRRRSAAGRVACRLGTNVSIATFADDRALHARRLYGLHGAHRWAEAVGGAGGHSGSSGF